MRQQTGRKGKARPSSLFLLFIDTAAEETRCGVSSLIAKSEIRKQKSSTMRTFFSLCVKTIWR